MVGTPIATVGNMHVCPMINGTVPHVGGPISGSGCTGVLIDGAPVSVMGDQCVCAGPPDIVIEGCPGVLADGMPVILMGSKTAHGGSVVEGVDGVLVGGAVKTVFPPLKNIPFPVSGFFKRAVAAFSGKSLIQANKAIKETKEDAVEKPFLPDIDFSV